uniref:Uncharacterized protein n=1 Tax=Anabas testudineus TaxID=64144 RepID=A0A3Q1I4K5_ANATE
MYAYIHFCLRYIFTLPESRLFALSLLTWDSAMSARSSFLELLLATLHGQILSLIQAVLQVLDSDLQVLLHPLQVSAGVLFLLQLLSHHSSLGIVPAPDLSIQSALHGVNYPLAVPLDLLNLLIFLCQLPVHLTLNLVELQLDTQDLRLFVFQSSLMILKKKLLMSGFRVFVAYVALIRKKHTSASSRAVWISDFSVSTCFLAFSSSWMLLPVSPICSVRSEISSA